MNFEAKYWQLQLLKDYLDEVYWMDEQKEIEFYRLRAELYD